MHYVNYVLLIYLLTCISDNILHTQSVCNVVIVVVIVANRLSQIALVICHISLNLLTAVI